MKLTARDLKTIRENQQMSQEKFGDVLHVSREMVNKMESGKVPVSAKTILKIQALFGPELEQLVTPRSRVSEPDGFRRKKERGRSMAVWAGVPMYGLTLNKHFTEEWKNARLGMPDFYLSDRNFMDCDFGAVIRNDQPVHDIRNGDTLLCQHIRDTGFLDYGNLYYIITTNGMELCRHLHPHGSDNNQLLLKAGARSVPDTPLPKKYIAKLFRIRGVLRGL